jgi:hypothetical protein
MLIFTYLYHLLQHQIQQSSSTLYHLYMKLPRVIYSNIPAVTPEQNKIIRLSSFFQSWLETFILLVFLEESIELRGKVLIILLIFSSIYIQSSLWVFLLCYKGDCGYYCCQKIISWLILVSSLDLYNKWIGGVTLYKRGCNAYV